MSHALRQAHCTVRASLSAEYYIAGSHVELKLCTAGNYLLPLLLLFFMIRKSIGGQ